MCVALARIIVERNAVELDLEVALEYIVWQVTRPHGSELDAWAIAGVPLKEALDGLILL